MPSVEHVNSPVRAFKSVRRNPLFIRRADGSRIYDADGNEYLDFVGSWGPMLLGHSHPAVKEAILQAAQDGTSYGAPALLLRGKGLLGFRVSKAHLSIFPFSAGPVEALADRLAGMDVSKGTIRFTADSPPPDDIVRDVVRLRVQEIEARTR